MLPIEYYNNDNTQPTHHDFQNVVEFEVTYLHFTEYYKLPQRLNLYILEDQNISLLLSTYISKLR